MQVTETREEFCVFEGEESACEKWIDENEDQFPESSFYIERV
jgi:hypothetical protein